MESTNKNLEIIRKSADCPIANPKRQWLFKIHGDLSDTSNMILTHSDYNNYFVKESERSIYWNTVKSRLVENHVIFVGYALEDNNVMVMIEKILNELGDNRKEMFFVAPSITSVKLKFLHLKGIEYIQSTGEELITEIFEDLKYNYIPGLSKGVGTADTALNFAIGNKISLDLSKSEDAYMINNVTSLDGVGKNEIKLKIEGEKEATNKLIDSLKGKDFEDVHLTGNILKEFSQFFNGIRIKSHENIDSLIIKKLPAISGLFDITFDDGFELSNYNLEIYVSRPNVLEGKVKIQADDFEILITIKFDPNADKTHYNFDIIPSNKINSTKNGINFYAILSRITCNQGFMIHQGSKLIFKHKRMIIFNKDSFDADFFIEYFTKLKKIEKYFNVRFTDIDLENASEKYLSYIMAYVDKIVLEEKFDGMTLKNENKEEFEYIINSEKNEKVLVISEGEKTTYNLHGLDFTIGYLHKYVLDGFVDNLEEINKGKTKIINLKSKSQKIYYQFTDSTTMITEQ